MLAIDWDDVTVATAFLLGAVLATIATLRLLRITLAILREEQGSRKVSPKVSPEDDE